MASGRKEIYSVTRILRNFVSFPSSHTDTKRDGGIMPLSLRLVFLIPVLCCLSAVLFSLWALVYQIRWIIRNNGKSWQHRGPRSYGRR